jgi:cephalosporin hydroxylase
VSPDPQRFVPFRHRNRRSEFVTLEIWESVQQAKGQRNGKAGVSWRGVPLMKDPWDIALYPMIIWELQPRTIIELGAAAGGSALWMADITTSFKMEGRIISVDIQLDTIQVTDPRIEFIQFDLFNISTSGFPVPLQQLPHPWLLIEDAHVNLLNVLEYFDPHIIKGDYVVVEDTCDQKKYRTLEQFMQRHGMRYRVDTHYVDNFGYNNTWNWNSIMACMADVLSG